MRIDSYSQEMGLKAIIGYISAVVASETFVVGGILLGLSLERGVDVLLEGWGAEEWVKSLVK